MKVEDLARLVLKTAELKGAMWNKESFLCHEEESKRQWVKTWLYLDGTSGLWPHIPKPIPLHQDPARFYYLDQEQCAEWACEILGLDTRLARFIDLSLEWWNDVLDWAEHILNPVPTKEQQEFLSIYHDYELAEVTKHERNS